MDWERELTPLESVQVACQSCQAQIGEPCIINEKDGQGASHSTRFQLVILYMLIKEALQHGDSDTRT